jgi:hypothetical protein
MHAFKKILHLKQVLNLRCSLFELSNCPNKFVSIFYNSSLQVMFQQVKINGDVKHKFQHLASSVHMVGTVLGSVQNDLM